MTTGTSGVGALYDLAPSPVVHAASRELDHRPQWCGRGPTYVEEARDDVTRRLYMQVAPASPAMVMFEQNWDVPASFPNAQQRLFDGSVQSELWAHLRTWSVDGQVKGVIVGQFAAVSHITVALITGQFGTVPAPCM